MKVASLSLGAALLIGLLPVEAGAIQIRAPAFTPSKAHPTWGLSVRTGPYRPRIAPEGDLRRDYFALQFRNGIDNSIFNHGPVLTTLSFDYYFLHSVGRLGVSANVGYWRIGGFARRCIDAATQSPQSCTAATVFTTSVQGDTPTSLTSIPLGLEVVYKADQLLQYTSVPLMPYVRVGANYHIWFAETDGNPSRVVDNNGNEVIGHDGGTFGLQFTGGLAFNLDWFSPVAGGERNTFGLVGSHIFVEASYFFANGFASPDERLDMSDLTGFIGLALDFD